MSIRNGLSADQFENDHYEFEANGGKLTVDLPRETIDARHSVRSYIDMPISEGMRNDLNAFVAHCNRESGLNIFIRYDDPDGFDSRLAHYGRFRNVMCMVIALGHGETQGTGHRGKTWQQVVENVDNPPGWFRDGVEAALKAPTAVNQQKFVFTLTNGEPSARVKGIGSYTKVDLGLVCWHFEAVTGRKVRHG